MEWVFFTPALTLELTLFLATVVCKYFEWRTPSLKLHFPIDHDCGWHYDQMWTPNTFISSKWGQQRNSLNSFAEAHLISQNAVQLLVMECYKPIQANNLVLSQWAVQQKRHFCEYICWLQISADRLECFRHFHRHISESRHLLITIIWFSLFKTRLWVINLDLFAKGLLMSDLVTLLILVHRLLDETLRVKFLSNTHWELQVLTHEVF